MKIGDRIRTLRKAQDLTLDEISKKTGVAIGTLSRIETNKMVGTIQSHATICEVLGITLPDLYKDLDQGSEAIAHQSSSEDLAEVYIHNETSTSTLLTSNILSKKMMPYLIKIQPSGTTQQEEDKPGTEKVCHVLKGSVEITVAKNSYRLKVGDTLYFKSSQPHWMTNLTTEETRCLCVKTPPTL